MRIYGGGGGTGTQAGRAGQSKAQQEVNKGVKKAGKKKGRKDPNVIMIRLLRRGVASIGTSLSSKQQQAIKSRLLVHFSRLFLHRDKRVLCCTDCSNRPSVFLKSTALVPMIL